jgi:hypothetical protein
MTGKQEKPLTLTLSRGERGWYVRGFADILSTRGMTNLLSPRERVRVRGF